jgi:proteic killer suppression protein
VIKSFKDTETKQLLAGKSVKRWKNIEPVARRKLVMIDAATTLDDLKVPPGNKLPKLDKDRTGQYGIRINDQYRVCFEWREGHAYCVEITDYH